MFEPLNFPLTELKFKNEKIWDVLRKKYVKHTPEEWVRQHMIHFLINQKGYSKNLMQSEHTLIYNGLKKRCDIVVFNKYLKPQLIVECKASSKTLTADTFYQIAKYYSTLRAPLLVLTNGLTHINALINPDNSDIQFLENLPAKNELESLTHDF